MNTALGEASVYTVQGTVEETIFKNVISYPHIHQDSEVNRTS